MRIRLVSLVVFGVLILVGAFLLLSPLWLPVAGASFAKRHGIEWKTAQADGYSTITLADLRYKGGAIEAELDLLKVPQPFPWLKGLFVSGRPALMTAGNLKLLIGQSDAGKGSSVSLLDQIMETERVLKKLLPYVPAIEMESANLRIEASGIETTLRELRLKDDAFAATSSPVDLLPAMTLRLFLAEGRTYMAARNALDGDEFLLRAFLKSGGGSPEFLVNARAGLGELIGPTEKESRLILKLAGGPESFSLQEFQIRSSWLVGDLSNPVNFNYASKTFAGSAELELVADLGMQGWIPSSGIIKARVTVLPPGLEETDLRFSLNGKKLVFQDIPIAELLCTGSLDYPVLYVSNSRLRLDEDSTLSIEGNGNIDKRELDGRASFALSPAWLERLSLPVLVNEPVSGGFEFSGPLPSPRHSGWLDSLALTVEGMPALTTHFTWQGTGLESVSLEGQLESGKGGQLELGLRVEKPEEGDRIAVFLDKATLGHSDFPAYILQSPVSAYFRMGEQTVLDSIGPVELKSPKGRLAGHYNLDTMTGSISGDHLDLNVFEAWTLKEFPPLIIDGFEFSVETVSPHLQASFDLSLRGTDALVDDLSLHGVGHIDASGLELSLLEGLVGGTRFCSGRGRIPLLIHPAGNGGSGSYSLIRDGALAGNLTAEISGDLLDDFPQIPFLDLFQGSRLDLGLGGTIESPDAALEMTLQRLDVLGMVSDKLDGLVFENVELALTLNPQLLEIQTLQATINNGRVDIGGSVPTEYVQEQLEAGRFDWRMLLERAVLVASLKDFRAAEFPSYLPAYLRPKGVLGGSIELGQGLAFSGNLELTGFGLRPTLYSQPVEQIQLGLRIDNTILHINQASAMLGDSLVNLAGHIDFNDFVDPLYSIRLTGKRVPLLRTTDLLLLSDLDLKLEQHDAKTPAILSGDMHLRDGVLLMDIDPLGARTSGKGLPKPPFFSITTNPFAGWNLDVSLSGENAVRFKSQFMNALLSVRADLSGTLENPVWVGEVRTTEGRIAFPGTNLTVSHGEFYITREQQDTIQLNVNTIGQTASYVISMRIGGNVEDPQVSFASTPALSNAQIFQLLATGSLDRSGVGSFGMYLGRGMFAPGGGREGLLDRISVEVGRDISESGLNTIDVFYDLSDRFRLHGQYDKYDAQNLDLEWEVFSK
ncbi:hypothetical protein G0Q06_10465 [Puniceicoccales bacterium CK1056]|uniref:Translocation and assembly module TamB C-terminal domain-containing protein n=1 Tax=Oceanipulchritudo coccoides TaxID=2706888 RepID=A0A6B2M442_9BACT|nr:translocation/assembly module TamB domain-containing protein [Oceanipulchritudo coccoides]NDV62874.1 hypothetical protein [Oceanipulchritudo coccoides]